MNKINESDYKNSSYPLLQDNYTIGNQKEKYELTSEELKEVREEVAAYNDGMIQYQQR